MNILLSLIFQSLILCAAVYITFIYSVINEYNDRSSLENFKPKLFKKGMYHSFNTYPLEITYPIDNIELTLVVPSYNEEKRLPIMIDQTIKFLESMPNLKYEIIIVNDGSRDNTWTVIEDLITKKYKNIDISGVTTTYNGGKGHAVKSGMKYARGKYILMLDADGATEISDFDNLYRVIDSIKNDDKGKLVIGSRSVDSDDSVKRVIVRKIFSFVNNIIVRKLIGLNDIKDTQCGFKLFNRVAAKNIFHNLHLARWAFDVEMLYIAKQLNMTVAEVPVRWREVEGSKLSIVPATISFFRDYFAIITYYNTGIWKIKEY